MKSLFVFALLLVAVSANIPRGQRVVGGDIAAVGQFPYAVGLITRINILLTGQCSGSLVSANYILTAARCVSGVSSAVAVFAGVRINDATEQGQVRITIDAARFKIHPQYEAEPDIFDVALLHLPLPVPFSERVRPVRLPNLRQIEASFAGQQATFIGWGRFGEGTTNSDVLRFGRAQVITTLACRINLPTNTIDDAHVCTDGANSSPCQGDVGAPLTIVDADGITTQIGVFSFISILGCESGRAAVHTRMSSYLTWIGQNSDVEIRDNFA
ncbi:chymotrypsin BI [Anopheles darlingi]|uniref:Chymotrypsin BI n=1 Tax=Anopheles darlingi TaxID=43151 RepID=W5J9N4_ANODA|nr:collagenase-like [Anopheles darlingi]ETN60711.1 chymotrypsin BI [Anopheles darlingi]